MKYIKIRDFRYFYCWAHGTLPMKFLQIKDSSNFYRWAQAIILYQYTVNSWLHIGYNKVIKEKHLAHFLELSAY